MTVAELRAEVERREAAGHRFMIVTVPRKCDPGPRRIRALPGVIGRCIGWNAGRAVVDVELATLRRFLARR